jgi:molecular chaperone GrpE
LAEEIEIVVEDQEDLAETAESQAQADQELAVEGYIEHLQRLKAEFDNYRKRVERERGQLEDRITGDFCKKLLPILDDLERTLTHTRGSSEAMLTGIKLVYKNLWGLLEREGLSRIPAVGQAFDPHIHEAVMVEADHSGQSEIVAEEIQPGYMHRGRLLRPAKVKVLKGSG